MQLRFLGGAATVSGAKLLVEHRGRRLLLDCGLFQGLKQLRLRNRASLGVPSRSIDAVVLTQAHAAHSAFLANALGYSKHLPALPLYTQAQAREALGRLQPRAFDDSFEPVPGFAMRLRPAGQALGAAQLQLQLQCGTHGLPYASTLGRSEDPLLRAPTQAQAAELLLVESMRKPARCCCTACASRIARTKRWCWPRCRGRAS